MTSGRRRLRAAAGLVLAAGTVVAKRGRPAVAIVHTNVVDVRDGSVRREMTVTTRGDRIVAVGPRDSVVVPVGAVVVDGAGTYVIPGLWDMHAHSMYDPYERAVAMPLEIAYGVTGVRDMAGDCFGVCADKDTAYNPEHGTTAEMVHRWERDIAAGRLLGPRMVAGSAMLDGPHPTWDGAVGVHDTSEARAAVRLAQARGADFIKVYSGLSAAAYFAIADEAKRRGMPFAGHVPDAVSLVDAADAGQASMEHLLKMPEACASGPLPPAAPNAGKAAQIRAAVQFLNASFDLGACAPVLARFVRDGTWQVPTLTMLRGMYLWGDTTVTHDARRGLMAAADTAWWQSTVRRRAAMFSEPTDAGAAQVYFHHHVEIVGAMHRAGVRLLAGTDVSNPWVYWGSSLHDELAMFVEAGLTPLAALQTATIEPARFLHATDTLGTVTAGKVADLVVLDGNPLADIRNTRRIRAVVVRGQLIDSAGRQRLIDGARGAARRM